MFLIDVMMSLSSNNNDDGEKEEDDEKITQWYESERGGEKEVTSSA